MRLRLRRPRGRAWIWALLTAGILANGLRLRGRLAQIPALAPAAGSAPGDEPLALVTAEGVEVDTATLTAATAHARAQGLDVVDLVPATLPTESLLDLARVVDPGTARTSPLLPGRGARHALAVEPEVLARAGLDRTTGLDPVEMTQATARLKQCAPRTTDLVAVPGLAPVAERPERRLALLRALAGQVAPALAAAPLAQYGLIGAGLVASPAWGAAALAAATVQPRLARWGTAFTPVDLSSGAVLGRALTLPRAAVATLRGGWQPDVVVPADPRAVEERRPVYAALLAGPEPFFEPRRDTCPWCGSDRIVPRFSTRDLTQHKPGRFVLDDCRSCGHVFQNPRLSPAGLDFYYRDFYDGLGEAMLDLAFGAGEPSYRGRVRMVKAVTEPTRWLDVGGGHGHFCLIAAEDLPHTRFDMIDLGEAAPDAARRGWVEHGWSGAFPDLARDPASGLAGSYDVVSMHHYLEHTRDPRAELAAARTVLAPGGHLLVEVPDPESRWAARVGPYWGPWFQPQHQHFVPIGNLCDALVEAGFRVVATERAEPHQPVDITSFVALVAQRTAPPPQVPWLPPRTPAQRAARLAVLGAFGPALVAAFVADQLLGPVLARRPGGSNTYRVLARATG